MSGVFSLTSASQQRGRTEEVTKAAVFLKHFHRIAILSDVSTSPLPWGGNGMLIDSRRHHCGIDK